MSLDDLLDRDAVGIASAFRAGEASASEIAEAALARIEERNPWLNAFTDVTAERARARAAALDAARARGEALPPLAAAPVAAKNLFDLAGIVTRAGSRINRDQRPATADATAVARLEAAGGVTLGALNMGEYAYDFTGENAHDGPSRNPRNTLRMTGGSSGGSGGAVAGGLAAIALGSDTNGSIRVPSAFCGTFGLKPTYGRLSRAGAFPFVASLDHVGPLARSVRDLAACYDALLGPDPADPACTRRAAEPIGQGFEEGIEELRIARLGGWFAQHRMEESDRALDMVAGALGATARATMPKAELARGAAFLITMAEAAELHQSRLRARAADFDPAVRDRLIAGSLLPAAWVQAAQRFRRWFAAEVEELFHYHDILLAPSTPMPAPMIGTQEVTLDGVTMPLRPNIGLYTQPISFIGLPVAAVPVWPSTALPMGVQVIAPAWREDLALRVARALEASGMAWAPVASLED
ncbi:AtzE family amidohydrolase [Roseomonas sp. PWR1]|uniref:AtzE family amidohydrolase n=1 Tax=Roseomonas nitratireducens TaxID=2820810 RepID=A0ABS4AT17_9PROT|nr:AtzE family amidohydrolase [Neoroseomonas nitratireducens]MBP0464437.1 AtzE family amidohydrolase [Neoroseomonas nitratireducens]